MKQQHSGPTRLVKATLYSLAGLMAAWRQEAAFRLECLLAAGMIPGAFWLGRDAVERSLLIATVCLVLIVELVNSAIESAVDRVGSEHHPLAGRAKDFGSAAVFVSLVLTLAVWTMIAATRL